MRERSVRAAVVGAAVLLLVTGCDAAEPAAEDAAKGRDPGPSGIDLRERFPVAERAYDVVREGRLDLGRDEAFTLGWHRGTPRWVEKRAGVIELSRSRASDFELHLAVAPPERSERLERQRLQVRWNGVALGTYALDWRTQEIVVPVPAEVQRVGSNRLTLLPSYWVTPERLGLGEDEKNRALRLSRALFAEDGETPAEPPLEVDSEARAVRQRPESVLTYYLLLPEEATLRARAVAADDEDAPAGTVQIVALDAEGGEHVLARRRVPPEGAFALEADLAKLPSRFAALSFVYRGEERAAAPDLLWKDLVVQGADAAPPRPEHRPGRDRYNVLIVLFDALRADATEPYGSTEVRTPAMRELAEEGVTFVDASSSSSWTRTSVASLFTSLDPSVHGTLEDEDTLSSDLAYLPEIFRDLGYTTLFMTTNPTTGRAMGFARGSQHMHEFWERRHELLAESPDPDALADHVWERLLRPVLPGENGGEPFFAYLHEPDPHGPYTPPAPYDTMYDFGYTGNLRSRVDTLKLILNDQTRFEAQDIRYLRSQYDGEITFIDRYLGRLLERLEESGLREDTLVMLISDHGEEFMEHEGVGHGVSLYQEQIHVPLVVSLPGVLPEGRRAEGPAALIDVPPTLLDLVGAEAPPAMAGRSLLPLALGEGGLEALRPRYAKLRESHDSVRVGRWKLVREGRNREGRYFDSYMLFDLERDPGETVNRWPKRPVIGKTLRQLQEWHLLEGRRRSATPETIRQEELDEGVIEELRALGYIE